MFAMLYEFWLGQNDDPIYTEEIFTPVGLITLLVALGSVALFYLILGRWRSVFHRVVHWVITLVMVIVFAYGYAVWYALDRTGNGDTDGYMQAFGGVNVLYGLIYFLVFSLLLKRFSIYARRTPF